MNKYYEIFSGGQILTNVYIKPLNLQRLSCFKDIKDEFRRHLNDQDNSLQSIQSDRPTILRKTYDQQLFISFISSEEYSVFGERCLEGYNKFGILGIGTNSIVWLARHIATGQEVALKQISFSPEEASKMLHGEPFGV